jgi:hypothetical protein
MMGLGAQERRRQKRPSDEIQLLRLQLLLLKYCCCCLLKAAASEAALETQLTPTLSRERDRSLHQAFPRGPCRG